MLQAIFNEIAQNFSFFLSLTIDHLVISGVAVIIATLIGLLLGIAISERPAFADPVISVVNVAYTIPSIALLGIFISITGIGNTTAIIALTVYALLPVVRNTYTGLTEIAPSIIEAALAMGHTPRQMLWRVKLPLAAPVIFSAVRNMVTMTIALAGIASFVGAGGLGVAIFRGITTNNKVLLLSGSILIALLALFCDWLLGLVEKQIGYGEQVRRRPSSGKRWLAFALVLLVGLGSALWVGSRQGDGTLELASKPTTEGYILAEIVAGAIEGNTDLKVNISHGIAGGTGNIHPAILKGDFDLYPEYTGTAWQVVLKDQTPYQETRFEELKERYEDNYGLTWRGMLGFNNTYTLAVRSDYAAANGLEIFSDLAPVAGDLVFGANYDFFEREDGFKPLTEIYGLHFKDAIDMDRGLVYEALFKGEIDVLSVFTTDGQASDDRIKTLKDDKQFYPSYQAGLVVRQDSLEEYPQLGEVLDRLAGKISEKEMAQMNYAVEVDKESPEAVAQAFLKKKGLIN
ncbi:ABC transporter permease/substrate-binding protein [Peptococcus simiae]|uniref:ABC transporter permease/substrate-binding protein n=1 Tax=Peptococcus simiae TaxID=1643805 RepID=A0ABW9GZ62_9FIRM